MRPALSPPIISQQLSGSGIAFRAMARVSEKHVSLQVEGNPDTIAA